MDRTDTVMSRLAARLLLGLTLLLLLGALAVTATFLLANALTSWLTPLVGQAGAYGIAGLVALAPLALLVLAATRSLAHGARHRALGHSLRQSVRENPWESVGTAFFLGLTRHGQRMDRVQLLLALLRPGGRPPNEQSPQGSSADAEHHD